MRTTRRPAILLAGTAAVLATLAACGTELPNSAFVRAEHQQQIITTTGPQQSTPNGTGPGSTTRSGSRGGHGLGKGHGHGSRQGDGVPPGNGNGVGPSNGPGPTGSGPIGKGKKSGSPNKAGGTSKGVGTQPKSGGKPNFASAPGVTATTITIGNISSVTNPFDPRAFVGPLYGLEAFVRYINAHGGIDGRQLILKTCDDQGEGDADVSCVQQLINTDHVFALVSNAILDYQGAPQVNSAGVPDIGSQPIDTPYSEYPNLFDIYGEDYPRNGHEIGSNGKLYGGTEVYHYFKTQFPKVPLKAGVVEYNQSDSERFGQSIVAGLQAEGYQVTEETVNFALPDFDSAAIAFKNAGVQYVYDTIDREGNVRLCDALQDNNVPFFAKVVTTQSWEQSVNSDYSSSKSCAAKLWTYGNTRNYEDTRFPEVAAFRKQMSADGDGGPDQLSEWALEGWAGAQWFADAAGSCGAKLTRSCVEAYMNRNKLYDGHGLLTPRDFTPVATQPTTVRNCINMAQWSVPADVWKTTTPNFYCAEVKNLGYSP